MSLNTQGVAVLGTTEITVIDSNYNPNISQNNLRHSNNYFASIGFIGSVEPEITITTTEKEAVDLVGLFMSGFTVFELYYPKVVDGMQVLTDAVKFSLATGAKAYAVLTELPKKQGEANLTQITLKFTGGTGDVFPLEKGTGTAPSVDSEPTLYTMGTVNLNGTIQTTSADYSVSLGNSIEMITTQGHKYPSIAKFVSGEVKVTGTLYDVSNTSLSWDMQGELISADCIFVSNKVIDGFASTTDATTITISEGVLTTETISTSVDSCTVNFSLTGLSSEPLVSPIVLS